MISDSRSTITFTSSRLFTAFWGLAAVEGALAFAWFAALPASESERSILFGLSLTRLIILAAFGLAVVYCANAFVKCLIRNNYALHAIEKFRHWFAGNDFPATAVMAVMLVWAFLALALEILLNPEFFPRSALYGFLYIRVRPIFLWSAAFCLQGFILALRMGWYNLKRDPSQDDGKRRRTSVVAGLAVLAAGNIGLWLTLAVWPERFTDPEGFALSAIILLAVLLAALTAGLNRSEA